MIFMNILIVCKQNILDVEMKKMFCISFLDIVAMSFLALTFSWTPNWSLG